MAARTRALEDLFGGTKWRMSLGERSAVEGILACLRPSVSVVAGSLKEESLAAVSAHSDVVHSFDLALHSGVDRSRFPNVVFHEGDSHELLPATLAELGRAGTNVDFALVDGDHTAPGVRRDLEDLLDSPAVERTVILVHDTLNERVRAGLEEVDFGRDKVTHVELDFVVGQLWDGGPFDNDLWGGLGLVVTGWDFVRPAPADARPAYDAVEVFSTFRRTLEDGAAVERPRYGEIHAFERRLADAQASLQ